MKDRVGALRDILDVFAKNSLTLTRILSVPTPDREGEFSFLMDVTIKDMALPYQVAIEDLGTMCSRVRIIGEVL
jgi:prephenate dehydratase